MTNENETPERIWALADRRKHWQDEPPASGLRKGPWVEYTRADLSDARIAELEAERDDLTERVDELQQACEVVSSEFEGELWQSCRRLLQKTGFDFHGADVDGIQADAFESHMNETLVEFDHAIARAKAAEAKLAKAVDLSSDLLDWLDENDCNTQKSRAALAELNTNPTQRETS